MNLSKHNFSIPQFQLLNKNLNFCPTPGNYDSTAFKHDIKKFTRKIKLKAHFATTNSEDQTNEQTQKEFYIRNPNSTWEPTNNHHTIKSFIEAVNNDIDNLPQNNSKRKYNLTKAERKALEELRDRSDLVITNADKGGAVVIQDTENYIKEANRQLNDTTFYKKCEIDLTNIHCEKVNQTVEQFKKSNLIPEKIASMLKCKDPKPPKFHTLPKIHKKSNPGRPVISSIGCHTTNISKYVDHHLQEHVSKLPSYVKDTTDFINKIKDLTVPDNAILVTMDVSSLYTNIPNDEGIEAVRETLSQNNYPTTINHVITTFLKLILILNNFVFNGYHYIQTKGCAMGTKCAPSYANIFMGQFEAKNIYSRIKDKSLQYLRYIDDIFMIWTGTPEELTSFASEINQVHPSIKFTFENSLTEINFLDTTVYRQNYQLLTKVYRKPTDRSMYLHSNSYHPSNLKRNIPYGQALRMKKICSEDAEFQKAILSMEKASDRGYMKDNLKNQFDRACSKQRQDLLNYQTREKTDRIPLVTTFHRQIPDFKSVIEKHWNLLQINQDLKTTFKDSPVYGYRRNKNLKDIIGQTTLRNNKVLRKNRILIPGKCSPCRSRYNNLCCRQVQSTSSFKSYQTQEIFKILHNTNCRSSNVIYLLHCNKCNIQYVGKTENPFNIRLNNHRHGANHPTEDTIPAAKHFSVNHEFNRDAKFTIIEQIKDNSKTQEEKRSILLRRENFWIIKLKTLTPLGLNQELN